MKLQNITNKKTSSRGGKIVIRKKINMYTQTTFSDCGLCCLAMVADYYGFTKTISYYRNFFQTGRDGIGIKDLSMFLNKVGLNSEIYKFQNLSEFNFERKPYILYTSYNHFVVIAKMNETFILYDPSSAKKKINIKDLQRISGGLVLDIAPNADFIKNKERYDYFKHVKKFFSDVRILFFVSLVSSLMTYLVAILIPLALEQLIDIYAEGNRIDFKVWGVNIGLVTCAYFLCYQLQNILTVKLQKKVNEKITIHTVRHLLKLPFSYFDNRGEENILYRMGLLPQITNVITHNFIQVVLNGVGITAISIYTVFRFPLLSLIIIFIILFLGIIILLFNKYMLSKKQDELAKNADANAVQTEIVTMILSIKSTRLTSYFDQQFSQIFETYNLQNAKNKSKVYLFNLLLSIYALLMPVISVIFVSSQSNITTGEIIFVYSVLGMILTNCTTFFTTLIDIIMVKPSLIYLNDMYDEKEIVRNSMVSIDEFKSLKIQNIYFKYNDAASNVLSNISLRLAKGEKAALVGVSGSGKTTLIKLISGLYRASAGVVTINDTDIHAIEEEFFLNNVAIVTQQSTIFNKTLKENITLGDDSIPEEAVWQSLKIVNLFDVINELPMQLNTIINNKGGNFSGGQAQRVALARAIVRNPSLLILDEATSLLDSLNEKMIYDNLKCMGMSILAISHRLSAVKDSDNIYVIDGGKIVEEGTHEQLIKVEKLYHQLYANQ